MKPTWHIIGDVHGHIDRLRALLRVLNWTPDPTNPYAWTPPPGATLVSVGDVVDRGPDSLACLLTLKHLVTTGHAEMVLGNHECRYRDMIAYLLGDLAERPRIAEGRLVAYLQLLGLPLSTLRALADWLDARPAWLELPGAIVTHAAWSSHARHRSRAAQLELYAFGRGPGAVRRPGRIALPTSGAGLLELAGDLDLPARAGWTASWRGPSVVIWGHQIVVPGAVTRIGRTVNVESGCFMGHALSAYVHPAGEVVQVPGTGRHWRRLLAGCLPLHGMLFPSTLDDVRGIIEREALSSPEDYLAWIELECEEHGLPRPPDPVMHAHAALFERVQARQ